jgi:hypothetical protein
MRLIVRNFAIAGLISLLTIAATAQSKKTGVVEPPDLKQIVPTNYYYDGQVAPVQMRNSSAVRLEGGKIFQAGLVDNSGYSSDVAAKYKGYFITETKLTIGDSTLAPGQYGFGFSDGKFRVMDVGGNDVLQADQQSDDSLKRPVPLKITADGENYRLYCGKKYVVIKSK